MEVEAYQTPALQHDEEDSNDLRNPDIVQKYRVAADIANGARLEIRFPFSRLTHAPKTS